MTGARSDIAALNDRLRATLAGGRVVMTAGVAALPYEAQARILAAVRSFAAFTPDNDPWAEHDFGSLDVDGIAILFKIDYFEKGSGFSRGANAPANEQTTDRVLTVMLQDDY